jgi:hypothetical protein
VKWPASCSGRPHEQRQPESLQGSRARTPGGWSPSGTSPPEVRRQSRARPIRNSTGSASAGANGHRDTRELRRAEPGAGNCDWAQSAQARRARSQGADGSRESCSEDDKESGRSGPDGRGEVREEDRDEVREIRWRDASAVGSVTEGVVESIVEGRARAAAHAPVVGQWTACRVIAVRFARCLSSQPR